MRKETGVEIVKLSISFIADDMGTDVQNVMALDDSNFEISVTLSLSSPVCRHYLTTFNLSHLLPESNPQLPSRSHHYSFPKTAYAHSR